MKLSVIIPCYNCSTTLAETVASCYAQGLDVGAFEIVMVDDGSTDDTKTVMEQLATEHQNIRLFFHKKNRGGGAARNTGIAEASGDIVYCLDSDNFFEPHSVKPILEYFKQTNADGVAFHERRFFAGNNANRYSAHKNTITNRSIRLFDIFNESSTLLDNFFYTKTAFAKTAGYPEHHGFDTQCFEVRFLAAGNTVQVCPDSVFWHRQAGSSKSYFERVYESGEFSLNMYYILEDIIHLLSKEARQLIFNYDVFGNTKLGSGNLMDALVQKYKNSEDSLFQTEYETYLTPNGQKTCYQENQQSDYLLQAVYLLKNQEHQESAVAFLKIAAEYPNSIIIPFNLLRCTIGASGVVSALREKKTLATARQFSLKKQTINLNPSILSRITTKLRKIFQ